MSLLERVAATEMLAAGRPVVVMLSGGRDSVALADLAVALAGPQAVTALHLNYGLRGPDSDGDEEACRELCDRLGIELAVERPRRPAGGGNLHAWAREARYAAGEIACEPQNALLAVGHTASDQAETVLYRLVTSPGRRALLGIPARSGRVVRPLLAAGVTRDQTAAWCEQRGLSWREDAGNADMAFARTRVRAGLLPALRAVDRRAEDAILQTAELLRDEAEALDAVVEELLAEPDPGISRERLAAVSPGLARLVLRRLAEEQTGRPCPRAARRLEDVLELSEGAVDVGDGARLVVAGGRVSARLTPGARRD